MQRIMQENMLLETGVKLYDEELKKQSDAE